MENFEKKRVISGFRLTDYNDSVFIAYGPVGSSMSFVEVSLKKFGEHRCLCGIDYGLCELRTNVKFEGENKKEVEDMMEHYCVFVPYTKSDNRENGRKKLFAIAYNDWRVQVSDGVGGRQLPSIRSVLWGNDIMV